MSAVGFLDSGPLRILTNRRGTAAVTACRQWLSDLRTAGRRVVVPEIADYEVRRELVRLRAITGLNALDRLGVSCEYLPLTTSAMRMAADLWAQARQHGRPTAPDPALDGDVILAAQAQTFGVLQVVVATANVGHFG